MRRVQGQHLDQLPLHGRLSAGTFDWSVPDSDVLHLLQTPRMEGGRQEIHIQREDGSDLGCQMGFDQSDYYSGRHLCWSVHTDRAAAVAAVYAFICGVFIYKELDFKQLFGTLGSACSTTGTTMVIIGCATAFTRILTIEKIPDTITTGILNFSDNMIVILLLINLLLLVVGCFMDTTPAMMVLSPILLPIAMQFGVDPIHFGLIMVVNLAIGFITPPLGINLFVAARVGRQRLETVCSGIIKFILVMILDLLLITFIPGISMILPNTFM